MITPKKERPVADAQAVLMGSLPSGKVSLATLALPDAPGHRTVRRDDDAAAESYSP